MAKKKTSAGKPAAKRAKSAGKPAAKKPAPAAEHNHEHEHEHEEEIDLDPIEAEAFELAQDSDDVRQELEVQVTEAATKAVRKVFQAHGIRLTTEQADKLTMVLFGD